MMCGEVYRLRTTTTCARRESDSAGQYKKSEPALNWFTHGSPPWFMS